MYNDRGTWSDGTGLCENFSAGHMGLIYVCTDDHRRKGKHRWMTLAKGSKWKYMTRTIMPLHMFSPRPLTYLPELCDAVSVVMEDAKMLQ